MIPAFQQKDLQTKTPSLEEKDFPGGSAGKESACNVGDLDLIPGSGRSLEKRMAVQSSILVWRIPWMGEPSRLQSIGSQRVRRD